MKEYKELLKEILENGDDTPPARENMPGTISLFGVGMDIDLSKGFPLVTGKKVSFSNIITELVWILKGDSNIKYLVDRGCNIWNDDAYRYYIHRCKEEGQEQIYKTKEEYIQAIKDGETRRKLPKVGLRKLFRIGDLGKVYGYQLRKYMSDQLDYVLNSLKNNPFSRRHIIDYWSPRAVILDEAALPPCHMMAQFNVREVDGDKYLDCLLYQRSGDAFLGVPYNIAFYSALTMLFCYLLDYKPGLFHHRLGNAHIYKTHIDSVKKYLESETYELPTLTFSCQKDFTKTGDWSFALDPKHFHLHNYKHGDYIYAPLSTGLKEDEEN